MCKICIISYENFQKDRIWTHQRCNIFSANCHVKKDCKNHFKKNGKGGSRGRMVMRKPCWNLGCKCIHENAKRLCCWSRPGMSCKSVSQIILNEGLQGLQIRKNNFVFLRNTWIEISLIPLFNVGERRELKQKRININGIAFAFFVRCAISYAGATNTT